MNRKSRSAIVLAGGVGKRFLGLDKSLVEVLGTPMLMRVLDAVQRECEEIVVSVGSPLQKARIEKMLGNARVTCDALEDFGPLEGIRQASRAVSHCLTAVVACDLPLLNPSVIDYLFSRIGGFDGVVPQWPDGKVEPLCAVFRTCSLSKAAEQAVQANTRKIMAALKELRIYFVPTGELEEIDPGLASFINVNSEQDLENVRMIAASFTERSAPETSS